MKLPKNILDIIVSNKTSLGDNAALPPEMDDKFLVFLVNEHYEGLLSHFDSIDIDELRQELSNSMSECKQIERNNKEALEKLCGDLVNELFQIPSDTISIDMKLVDKVDVKQERLVPERVDYSFEDIDDINSLSAEIYKRRLLNAIIVGASMFYGEMVDSYKKELSHINKRLIYLYKKIMTINDILLFHTKQDIRAKQEDGGRVDVYLSDSSMPVRIEAQGIIFPVLLQETIKGILELSISHGLPSDRTKAQYITSKSDFKLAEIWDQRLGLPLWKRINNVVKHNGDNSIELGLNFLLMELSMLPPSKFNPIMQEIFANTTSGQKLIGKLSMHIKYQKEQDDFDDFITNMQSDNEYPINDNDEFSSDELINDDLCSSAILDETDY